MIPAVVLLASAVYADEVYLASGDVLKGLVVEEHHDRVVLSAEEGEKTILRAQVEEIFYAEPERNYIYLGHRAMDSKDFSLARGLLQKALQINPRFSEAEDSLHRLEDLEGKASQSLPAGGAPRTLEKALGITLKAGEPYALAAEVREGSSAQRAGMLPDDALAAVWGYSLAFLDPPRAAAELMGPPGTQIKLTIERMFLIPGEKGKLSFDLEMGRLGLAVLRVHPSGAASRAGLLPGDRIVRISEESTRYMPLTQAQRKVSDARERGIRLVIHRDLMVPRE